MVPWKIADFDLRIIMSAVWFMVAAPWMEMQSVWFDLEG